MHNVSFALSALVVVAAASITATQTSSMTLPTLDMDLSAFCLASCVQHCATDRPNGDGGLLIPGETERDLANADYRENAKLGAARVPDTELPNATMPLWTDVVVSEVAAPVAHCKLA